MKVFQATTTIVATPAQLFANPSANNFQLSATSPAINAGTSTNAPSTDFLGNPRPTGTSLTEATAMSTA